MTTPLIKRLSKLEMKRGAAALSAVPDAALDARILQLAETLGYRWADMFPDPTSAELMTMIATIRRDIDASV